MITSVYLICIAFGNMSWPLWGIIVTGIIDVAIAQALSGIHIKRGEE